MEELTEEIRSLRALLVVIDDRMRRAERRVEQAEKRGERHRVFSALLALALLVSVTLGSFFLVDAAHEKDRICDAIWGSAEALIAATDRPPDAEPPTTEQQNRRDEVVAAYRARVAAGCPR